jgi:hypothetical protein
MKTSKVFTTPGFRRLSTDPVLFQKGKLFSPRQNQGRIREVGLTDHIFRFIVTDFRCLAESVVTLPELSVTNPESHLLMLEFL